MNKISFRATIFNIVSCILTVFTFSIKLDIADLAEGQPRILYLTRSFQDFSVLQVFLVPILYHYYKFVDEKIVQLENKREHSVHSTLSVLMSVFILLGYSYERNADWNLILNVHKLQWLKVLISFMGYYALFDKIFAWLLSLFKRKELWFAEEKSNKFEKWLARNPYPKILIIFILGYIPYIICSYPAIIMPDTVSQIIQAYDELGQWTPYYCSLRHLNENIHLNAHHPVAHTLLIHWCIEIGRNYFESYNIGLFLYALIQAVFQLSVFSAVVSLLIKIKVKWYWILLTMLYYLTAPGIVSYVMLGSKDTLYASFMLLFMISIFNIICAKEKRRSTISLYLSSLGMFLFRNDGKYVLLISIVIMFLICKNERKKLIVLFTSILFVSAVYSELLLPHYSITSGSKREMLSIPFQQTARYLRYSSDGVTQEEKAAIDAVLDYDSIAKKYDPERSDDVKGTYNELASREEIINYLNIWLKMFFKHPSHYLQATINNYYYYFYPGTKKIGTYGYSYSSKCMNNLNERGAKLDMDFHYPDNLDKIRNYYELLRNELASFPIVSMIMSAAIYTWGLLLIIGYMIAHRIGKGVSVIAVPFAILLICLTGPCNGWYYRYLYPIAAGIPLIYFTVFYIGNMEILQRNQTDESYLSQQKAGYD